MSASTELLVIIFDCDCVLQPAYCDVGLPQDFSGLISPSYDLDLLTFLSSDPASVVYVLFLHY